MPEIRRTLIPQFSLRWILALIAAMAVVSLVFSRAMLGDAWAGGIALGLVALATAFGVYVAMFVIALIFGWLLKVLNANRHHNPSEQEIANHLTSTEGVNPVASQADPTNTSNSIKTALGLAAVFTLLTLGSSITYAASGTLLQMPQLQPGEVNKTGLALTLNMFWVDASGYRPARVSVKSISGPVTADRVLTLTFRATQGYTTNESIVVTQTLEIPAGNSFAEATLATPQLCAWGMFALDVYEDGEYVKQLSVPENPVWTRWGGTPKGDGASPATLLLTGVEKLSSSFLINPSMELMCIAPDDRSAQIDPQIAAAANAPLQSAGSTPAASTLSSTITSLRELPTHWIDYTCFDVMLISFDKLQEYRAQKTTLPQFEAIKQWLYNGGTLIVYDAGPRWKNLGQIEQLVEQNNFPNRSSAADLAPIKQDWNLPLKRFRDQPLMTDVASANTATIADSVEEKKDSQASAKFISSDIAPFTTRTCGLGLVVAIPSEESIASHNYPWTWLFNTVGPERWQWSRRWGVSLYQNNNDFWNFVIPGVGLVPVTQFQVLITLFVIVLGPVNYYVLRRYGRLNLMVLTVPAGALLITAALLLYALVEDGLNVRVRARSITHLDQRTGEATCWARLSYYAGITPSSGLKFAEDTAVIPLSLQGLANDVQPVRTLDWQTIDPTKPTSPLEQHLATGWLLSRTPTQFITARIRKCSERLEIQSDAATQSPRIVNHLSTPIKRLLLVDENQSNFMATDSAPDEAISLVSAPAQSEVYTKQFEPLLNANAADALPAVSAEHKDFFGFRERQQYASLRGFGYGGMPFPNAGNVTPLGSGSGMLERSLDELRNQMLNNNLPPQTYVAIVESSPEVQWGTSSVRPEESLHVIVGRW